jgi:hypothetical protein
MTVLRYNRYFKADGADDVALFAEGKEEPTRLAKARFGTLRDLLGLGRNRQDQEAQHYGRRRAGKTDKFVGDIFN